LAARCGSELLACEAFEHYIAEASWQTSPRVPDAATFARVFSERDLPTGGQRRPCIRKPRRYPLEHRASAR
jgi:hypothetical protein